MKEEPIQNKSNNGLLILGIGNYLMGDEGVGCHFIDRYQNDFPDHIDIIDGGTSGFLLMPYFEQYEKIILIDATLDDKAPGTINLIKPKFASDFPNSMSTHDIGLKDVITGLTLLGKVPEIYLFTVSIDQVQPMEMSLSKNIEKAIEELKDQVDKLIDIF